MGGGHDGSLDEYNILIAVAASASMHEMLTDGQRGLLIADECHHYGATRWSRSLEPGFERRLGLTATYEREDDGIEEFLSPYFRTVCYELGYKEALSEGVIADFKIAFLGVGFTEEEAVLYEEAEVKCLHLSTKLISQYAVSGRPFGEFIKEVSSLAKGSEGEATITARKYLKYFAQRRKVLAGAEEKKDRLGSLARAIRSAERTILFTQTQHAAREAVATLGRLSIRGAVLDASMDLMERKTVFAAFEDGKHELIAAPMLLDEGIDVPSADLAIVLAASRSKRQMIQRMGRVLRRKHDARLARIVILFVEGTSEDPASGAHETFVDLIEDAATKIETFDSQADSADICWYLNHW
jgi:RNA polymerase primary sigma factor